MKTTMNYPFQLLALFCKIFELIIETVTMYIFLKTSALIQMKWKVKKVDGKDSAMHSFIM